MDRGVHIWVDVPLEARARQCALDYGDDLAGLREGLSHIQGLPAKVVQQIGADLESGRLTDAAGLLLLEYYDPLYRRHSPSMQPERYAASVAAEDADSLVSTLSDKLSEMETSWTQLR